MNQYHYLSSNDETTRAVFSLLGGERNVLLCVAPEGHVLWLTAAAARLLDLHPMSPVAEAFSEPAAHAILRAVQDGAWLDMDEEIEGEIWRLQSHPVPEGLLLAVRPAETMDGMSKTEYARNRQQANIIGSMLSLIQDGIAQAEDEKTREKWLRMKKLAQRAKRTHLHGEIINGAHYLDDRLKKIDLTALCREAAEEAADIGCLPIYVSAEKVEAVASMEEIRFIVLNLLTNAIASGPDQIHIGLRRAADRIYLSVSDDSGVLEPERIAELLGGWQGSAEGCSEKELAKIGLGLPAVQRLLGKRGGSLVADIREETTRFIAVLPGDLYEDPWEVHQESYSSGIENLTELELSVL